MDKWSAILLDVEEMWENSASSRYTSAAGPQSQHYRIRRDTFKAERIYSLYGYDWFVKFVEERPHIHNLLNNHHPCDLNDGQCTMFCYFFKNGGCIYATK